MAESAGSREQPATAGRSQAEAAANKGEEESEMCPEPVSLEIAAVVPGRRRERRSGLALPGAADRFPASPGTAAAESEASLLEAARATPRRSSIIKVSPAAFCAPVGVVDPRLA
uniref:Uncharacterized protein n=1 Tax=Sphenodon punctatus TaxID=8508 RepID=A0A8D0G2A5_SPHPU